MSYYRFTFGSLFAGIGGFDLGLERAGMECRWQVEIDDYATKVLEKHWPHVKRYRDICTIGAGALEPVDLICGGFPCQDISRAGGMAGIDKGIRSGLWREMLRVIRLVRPPFVIVENVAALLDWGMGRVLGDLADCGFDAEWSTVSACSMGAAHMRQRVFVVAYPNGFDGWKRIWDTNAREIRSLQEIDGFQSARTRTKARLENPSALYGGADGIPHGMDRNRAIGNAVYPDVAEWIGRRILMESRKEAPGIQR